MLQGPHAEDIPLIQVAEPELRIGIDRPASIVNEARSSALLQLGYPLAIVQDFVRFLRTEE